MEGFNNCPKNIIVVKRNVVLRQKFDDLRDRLKMFSWKAFSSTCSLGHFTNPLKISADNKKKNITGTYRCQSLDTSRTTLKQRQKWTQDVHILTRLTHYSGVEEVWKLESKDLIKCHTILICKCAHVYGQAGY